MWKTEAKNHHFLHFSTRCCQPEVSLCCGKVPAVPKAHPQRTGGCSLALGHARTPGTQNPEDGGPRRSHHHPDCSEPQRRKPALTLGGPFSSASPSPGPTHHCHHRASTLLPKWLFPQVLILLEEIEVEWERDENSDLGEGLRCLTHLSSISYHNMFIVICSLHLLKF